MARTSIVLLALVLASATASAAGEGFVVICPVEGMIDDGVGVLVDRAVREAEGAEAIIFVVDTPGGMLDSAIEISKTILDAPCHTIAYIVGMGAISAGALISYSCEDMIMAPDANIGAATPVIMSAEGMQPTSEKEVSFMRAKMRALAERNNHNRSIAEAMVDKDIELRAYVDETGHRIVFSSGRAAEDEKGTGRRSQDIAKSVTDAIAKAVDVLPDELDDLKEALKAILPEEEEETDEKPVSAVFPDGTELVLAEGKLLTLTPQEAIDYGVIPTTASNVEEVMAYYGCHGLRKHEIVPTWSEALFRWLTSPIVAGLILMLGVGGLYMEMKTPGFGVFGIVGIICLTLFFGSHLLIGLAEWIDVILVLVGVGLIVLEVLVLPGFGIAGVAGICCLVLGLYMSLTHVTIPRYSWDFQRLEDAGTSLVVAFLTFAVFLYASWKALPHTPLWGWLVQSHSQQVERGYTVQTARDEDAAIGLEGVATSKLRPVGRGRFGQRTYQVVSHGEYVQEGAPIVIVKVEGNRYVVDRLPDKPDSSEDKAR